MAGLLGTGEDGRLWPGGPIWQNASAELLKNLTEVNMQGLLWAQKRTASLETQSGMSRGLKRSLEANVKRTHDICVINLVAIDEELTRRNSRAAYAAELRAKVRANLELRRMSAGWSTIHRFDSRLVGLWCAILPSVDACRCR